MGCSSLHEVNLILISYTTYKLCISHFIPSSVGYLLLNFDFFFLVVHGKIVRCPMVVILCSQANPSPPFLCLLAGSDRVWNFEATIYSGAIPNCVTYGIRRM